MARLQHASPVEVALLSASVFIAAREAVSYLRGDRSKREEVMEEKAQDCTESDKKPLYSSIVKVPFLIAL